jgi:hypothetical protein
MTVDDLHHLIFDLGHRWGEIPIYKAVGIKIMKAMYENLFKMAALGRIDFFSREVSEVFLE